MKTRLILATTFYLLVAVGFYSCQDEELPEEITVELTEEESDNLLLTTSNFRDRLRSSGIGGPMGIVFQLTGNTGGRTETSSVLGSIRNLMKGTNSAHRLANDSSDVDELPDCVIESYEWNSDGTYRYELDFGDGCDVFGEVLKGKLIEEGSYSLTTWTSTTHFIGFGGENWEIDGTDSYDGSWNFDVGSEILDEWEIYYTYESDLTQSFEEEEEDGSVQAYTIDYEGDGEESMNQLGYTVTSRNSDIVVNTGEEFSSQVDTPLFMDFACSEDASTDELGVFIYVTGVESGSATDGTNTYTYSIDYGDGTCDNIITITENGNTYEVDLSEEWYDGE